jgi:hypothetical protein
MIYQKGSVGSAGKYEVTGGNLTSINEVVVPTVVK